MEERRRNQVKTALIAVAKNEGPYIREWVVYHKKVCGFSEIFVYENDSTDNTRSELESMAAEGLCGWKPWPRSEQNPPQQKAYWDAEKKRKKEWDWMCLLDVDEFLVLRTNEQIGEFVSRFDENTGSISFNWVIFYSKDKKRTSDPVIKRVNYCYGDSHVKTIARTKFIANAGIHAFWLLQNRGYKYMHCSGQEYNLEGRIDARLEATICIDPKIFICDASVAQINHYMMKSEEEVEARDARGRATTKHYVKKKSKKNYDKLIKKNLHHENNSIKKYIESIIGLENFYEEIKK
jgi:hypothetical protein